MRFCRQSGVIYGQWRDLRERHRLQLHADRRVRRISVRPERLGDEDIQLHHLRRRPELPEHDAIRKRAVGRDRSRPAHVREVRRSAVRRPGRRRLQHQVDFPGFGGRRPDGGELLCQFQHRLWRRKADLHQWAPSCRRGAGSGRMRCRAVRRCGQRRHRRRGRRHRIQRHVVGGHGDLGAHERHASMCRVSRQWRHELLCRHGRRAALHYGRPGRGRRRNQRDGAIQPGLACGCGERQ